MSCLCRNSGKCDMLRSLLHLRELEIAEKGIGHGCYAAYCEASERDLQGLFV